MQYAMQLFERLNAEIPKEEGEFPKILEQCQTLGKPLNVPLLSQKGEWGAGEIDNPC